ncbi:MAG: iron-sulfur cluster-binding domain-containing protein [Pirellulaceae bacterium]
MLLITILAVSLIAISTCQFASIGIASGRSAIDARRRRELDLRGLRQAAEISRLNSELQTSELQSSTSGAALGWRVMEVAKVVDESADARSFYLVDVYRQSLPSFRPGQHVLVRPALAGAFQTTRCYSLSSSPDSRYWRITVKRETEVNVARRSSQTDDNVARRSAVGLHRVPADAASTPSGNFSRLPGRQQGGLSTWLHDNITAGDCLLIGGPSGHFLLREDNPRPLVLLAAGVGITPMASMLLWSQQSTPARPVRLLYQSKDLDHWPLGQSLHQTMNSKNVIRVVSYFSRMREENLLSLGQRLPGELCVGKFTSTDALAAATGLDCDYFMCGPNEWMTRLRDELCAAGVAAERVHWESFGSIASSQVAVDQPSPSHELAQVENALMVRFEHSQVDAAWTDPQQSLWELARQHHVDLPSGCLSGVCGCCRVKLLEGEVIYDRPISVELSEGECLTCVARPKTACRLDV